MFSRESESQERASDYWLRIKSWKLICQIFQTGILEYNQLLLFNKNLILSSVKFMKDLKDSSFLGNKIELISMVILI